VVLTLVVNTAGGQLIAWQNKLTPAEGLNASAMLQNRGEFALILATLAVSAGLDPRLTPFAGLYVLSMAIIGPVLAVNSEKIGAKIFPPKKQVRQSEHDRMAEENIALVEAAMAGQEIPSSQDDDLDALQSERAVVDPIIEQAMQQSDEQKRERTRDPEY